MWQLLFLLLPVATVCGWYFGYRHSCDNSSDHHLDNVSARFSDNYFLGLNYLINEQPDKAVDAFIKVLSVDNDTVDMHLVLGSLFRRRGEADRAIKIHKNLIARPQLTKEQRDNAIAELAQDYLSAGMLDSSERLFLELVEINKENTDNYSFLLKLYEKQKDWRQAIAMVQKLASFQREKIWTPIAYYYCELAEEAKKQGLIEQAEVYLKKALVQDKSCVRASIMLGELAIAGGHYKTALYFYKQVKKQSPDFLSEIAPQLVTCYEKLKKIEELVPFLQVALEETYSASLALFLARYMDKTYGTKAAIDFIAMQNRHGSSLRILSYLLKLCVKEMSTNGSSLSLPVTAITSTLASVSSFVSLVVAEEQPQQSLQQQQRDAAGQLQQRNMALIQQRDEQLQEKLHLALDLLDKLLEGKPYYRCVNCGLGTKHLYWQCPGCKRWATVKPIRKFEIE